MKVLLVPVTPFQQNCSIIVCEKSNRCAVVDPGGDLDQILAAVAKTGATLEKILLTHGHIDHCGGTAELKRQTGVPVEGRISSLRKVDWDSFNVNFFVVAPPGLMDRFPVSYVTSFYLPPGNVGLLNALVKQFPNFLLIDVAQVLGQVQTMITQVSRAVQFVFLFTLLAGLVVLYAAIASTQDERLYQATIMRTLGASRSQLARANLAEFAVIGALAGLIAVAGANALGYVLAQRVINVGYEFSYALWGIGIIGTVLGVMIAGHLGTRHVLRIAPLRVLRMLS